VTPFRIHDNAWPGDIGKTYNGRTGTAHRLVRKYNADGTERVFVVGRLDPRVGSHPVGEVWLPAWAVELPSTDLPAAATGGTT
jgi:hypothetical protein